MILAKTIGDKKAEQLADDPVKFVQAFDRQPWDYQADILREITRRDESGRFLRRIGIVSLPSAEIRLRP